MTQVALAELIAGICAGKVASFPTDTVPALAALPDRADLIFKLKQRRQDKPLILMGAKASDLWDFVTGSVEEQQSWRQMARLYWPGALTLVLPASTRVPQKMNPTDPNTIGLRVPKSAIAQNILAQTGPLATTSANLSGQPPLATIAQIAVQFPDVLTSPQAAANDGVGVPSTVAKWTGSGWEILRQGAVKLEF